MVLRAYRTTAIARLDGRTPSKYRTVPGSVAKLLRIGVAVGALATIVFLATAPVQADEPCPCTQCAQGAAGCPQRVKTGGPNDLFYNYYVPPANNCGVGAEMYPCPRPTPTWVGQTYITYQPFLAQEFMYHHCRTYCTRNPGSGWTSTHVEWGGCDLGTKLHRLFIGPN